MIQNRLMKRRPTRTFPPKPPRPRPNARIIAVNPPMKTNHRMANENRPATPLRRPAGGTRSVNPTSNASTWTSLSAGCSGTSTSAARRRVLLCLRLHRLETENRRPRLELAAIRHLNGCICTHGDVIGQTRQPVARVARHKDKPLIVVEHSGQCVEIFDERRFVAFIPPICFANGLVRASVAGAEPASRRLDWCCATKASASLRRGFESSASPASPITCSRFNRVSGHRRQRHATSRPAPSRTVRPLESQSDNHP